MKLSILGSGWLGLPLAAHFVSRRHVVNASTRTGARLPSIEETGATGFLLDIEALDDSVNGFLQADILIVNITSKNIEAFARLVEAVANSPVTKVLFVSSTSVYQNVNRVITESDTGVHSDSPLLSIEKLFTDNQAFETTVLRFGGLIDQRRHPGRFFASGRTVQNADTPVNLIHFDDCIGIISLIVQQGCWGEVFNASTHTHPSKREFYSRAIELYGGSQPDFVDATEAVGKIISNQKIKRLLNYEFKYPDLMSITFTEAPGNR